jgi:hypothetical protein
MSCGGVVSMSGRPTGTGAEFVIAANYPTAKSAHEDLPERVRIYLQQALESLHAPDAAAMVAGSAVDAMLKANGYAKGSLYERIDQALADNLLTKGSRLGSRSQAGLKPTTPCG